MVSVLLKGLFVPNTPGFLILALLPGILLLYRRKDDGRAGRRWVTTLVLLYVVWSTPLTAVPFVNLLSPSYPPVMNIADARGATAVVVLGAGIDTYRSRGDVYSGATREHALRILEGARVYRALDHPWVIVTGGFANDRTSQAHLMAVGLTSFGVDADRIIEEPDATNTRDHVMLVPPILKERGVKQFVLVTSQQHIARALKAFQKVGWDPVPSTPDVYIPRRQLALFLPSQSALDASSAMVYDELAMAYYWLRGWV
jgi:uncharacterized SAM-binding protein YcdF (DUF218 family)